VTDDLKEAETLADETWGKTKIQEKAVFTKVGCLAACAGYYWL
jgi:hypothetical protein